ncbi:universal stress protein [Natrinema ejinorense]|uniref:UspA domain-containing protein n=1 Tax=Natrinema ejinorense TaxID=373386 RepID=A0A2A5QPY9_9EURY|nr:universal stress protein [Natrinema ejinorense]PCR88884.1 hypothetical protein CP557_20605 [Natrinema ejinorense]
MTILAATDAKNAPDRVVEVAADLADAYDDELIVLHVLEEGESEELPLDSGAYTYSGDTQGEEYNRADHAMEIATKVRNRTLGNGSSAVPRGRSGEPEEQIVNEANAEDARYLVVGGRQRTPVGKVIFGSTTQSVLLDADQPVVTVRQE